MATDHELSAYVGLEYYSSLTNARAAGVEPYRIQVTRPPYPSLGEGSLRIVGERLQDGQRQWILAYERYHRQRGKEKRSGDERSGAASPP